MADIRTILAHVDAEPGAPANPPTHVADDVKAHQCIAGLVRNAYSAEVDDPRLEFLGQRVVARAKDAQSGMLTRLAEAWHSFVARPVLAYGSLASVLVLVIAAAFTASRLTVPAEAARMQSFVIYQTEDGNAFVRYFDYREVTQAEDGDEAS